jgi:large subunit ribosomal protein L31
MKTAIHPEVFETTVHCNGCNTTFTTISTVKDINVEICSNCHPFYTGKQKLIDTAGRVDKFKARQAAASKTAEKAAKKSKAAGPKDAEMAAIATELESETVPTDSAAS